MINNLRVAALTAAITVFYGATLVGCAPQSLKDSQAAIEKSSIAMLGTVGDHDVSQVRSMDVQYIGTQKTASDYVEPLPDEFDGKLTLTRGYSLTFSGLAVEIYKAQVDSGLRAIPVVVMPQLRMDSAGNPVVQVGRAAPTIAPNSPASGSVPPELQGLNFPDLQKVSGADISDFDTTQIPPLKYERVPLKKLLDDVTASNNLAWRYVNGKIVIYRYVSKTVRLNGIPGSSSLITSITRSGGGISGASGGGSIGGAAMGGAGGASMGGSSNGNGQGSLSQSTKLDADKLDIWESLKKTIPSMLSNMGIVIVNPSMGTITMRDEPVVVDEVSRYLDVLNASMAKQVAIDVTIYMVSLNEKSQYGINWKAAFTEAGQNFGLSGASMALPQVAAGAAALSFLIPETATDPNWQRFSGSQLLVNALETVGTITNRYSVPVRTQNLQPVQVANKIQEAYLAQTGVVQTANVGSATNNIPGLLTTGLELALLPHIQDTNDVVIQYGVTLSAKKNIRTIPGANGGTIEAPEVGLSDFVGRTTMRSGQTLVMSGLEQMTMQLDETGNLAAGGGWTKNGQHIVMVLSITPRLEAASNDTVIWPFKFLKNPEASA